jgi:putative transposase
VRNVYNWGLRTRTDASYQRKEHLFYEDLALALTALKRQDETAWLSEVSSVPLQQSLRHLESAFRHFFDGRAKYPKFKKKRGPQAATYASSAFKWDGKHLILAKMETPLDIRWSCPRPLWRQANHRHGNPRRGHALFCLLPGRRGDSAPAGLAQDRWGGFGSA